MKTNETVRQLAESVRPQSADHVVREGLDFETVELRYGAQREELLRVNPRGEVPVLQDGEAVVTGSALICEYLEEKFPAPPLLPADPAERARCRAVERIADTHTDVLQFFLALITSRRPELKDQFPDVEATIHGAIDRHFQFLDQQLSGCEYFAASFSRADIALVPHVTGVVHLGHSIPSSYPNLTAWLGRMLSRASVQQDAEHALAAWQSARADTAGFFRNDRIHWRGERVEWALRFGLGSWLLEEMETGRAYFSETP